MISGIACVACVTARQFLTGRSSQLDEEMKQYELKDPAPVLQPVIKPDVLKMLVLQGDLLVHAMLCCHCCCLCRVLVTVLLFGQFWLLKPANDG